MTSQTPFFSSFYDGDVQKPSIINITNTIMRTLYSSIRFAMKKSVRSETITIFTEFIEQNSLKMEKNFTLRRFLQKSTGHLRGLISN